MTFICAICRDFLNLCDKHRANSQERKSLEPFYSSPQKKCQLISLVSNGKLQNDDFMVTTFCGHLFHYACLKLWLSHGMKLTRDTEMRCPSCNQLIYIYELIQSFPAEYLLEPHPLLEYFGGMPIQQQLKSTQDKLEPPCREPAGKFDGSLAFLEQHGQLERQIIDLKSRNEQLALEIEGMSEGEKAGVRKSVTFPDPLEVGFRGGRADSRSFSTMGTHQTDFKIGDKVMWNFEGRPELGTVKWKGFVGSHIHVGVEFEKQLGLANTDQGRDALDCIFKCKPGHGRMVPVSDVVPYYAKPINGNHSLEALYDPNKPAAYSATSSGTCKMGSQGIYKRIQDCTHQ